MTGTILSISCHIGSEIDKNWAQNDSLLLSKMLICHQGKSPRNMSQNFRILVTKFFFLIM